MTSSRAWKGWPAKAASPIPTSRPSDALGARGRGAQDDGRGGDTEVGAVVLPDADGVEPDLLGQLDLPEQIAQAGGRIRPRAAARVRVQLRERVD